MGGFYLFLQATIICAHLHNSAGDKKARRSRGFTRKSVTKKVGTNNFRPYFQFSIFSFQFLPTGMRSR